MNIGITRLNEILAAESKRQQVVRATAILPRGVRLDAWFVFSKVAGLFRHIDKESLRGIIHKIVNDFLYKS
jgi:hypothetical protein